MEVRDMAITRTYTADEAFDLGLDARYELIDGELQILPGSGHNSSAIGTNLIIELGIYLKHNPIGVLTGENGGYLVRHDPDRMYCPDVGFLFNEHLDAGKRFRRFAPYAPDFAIEVISPTDRRIEQEEKVLVYLAAGTRLVWLVDPNDETVTVFRPERPPMSLGANGTLTGEDLFPGFTIPVAMIFRQPGEE
jgi:Uma2 family endonuclease